MYHRDKHIITKKQDKMIKTSGTHAVWLWLWLWRRPAAAAPIQPLAQELPYAAGAAIKKNTGSYPLPFSPMRVKLYFLGVAEQPPDSFLVL